MNTKITKKLEQLETLLNQIDEARAINPDDPETWDSDTLYNLVENCKAVIKLLGNKKHSTQKDPFGDPVVLEAGLCSLVDEYTSEEEDEDNYE